MYNLPTFQLDALVILRAKGWLEHLVETLVSCTPSIKLATNNLRCFSKGWWWLLRQGKLNSQFVITAHILFQTMIFQKTSDLKLLLWTVQSTPTSCFCGCGYCDHLLLRASKTTIYRSQELNMLIHICPVTCFLWHIVYKLLIVMWTTSYTQGHQTPILV